MYSFAHGKMKFDDLKPVVQRNSTQINNQPAAAPSSAKVAAVVAPVAAVVAPAAPSSAKAAPSAKADAPSSAKVAPVVAPVVAAPYSAKVAPVVAPVAAPSSAKAAAPSSAKAAPRNTRHSVNTERSKPFPEDKRAKTEIPTNAIGDPLPVKPRLIKIGQGKSYGPGIPIMNIARVNRK
jgi:hypothetical protein